MLGNNCNYGAKKIGPVSKVLTIQARKPDYDPLSPCAGTVWCHILTVPVLGVRDQWILGVTGQPAWRAYMESSRSMSDPASINKRYGT